MLNSIKLRFTLHVMMVVSVFCGSEIRAQLLNTGEVLRGLPGVEADLDVPLEISPDARLIDEARSRLASVPGLGILPSRLEIPNLQGAALVEVEVENGWRAIEREWLMLIDDASLPRIQALDVHILETRRLSALNMSVVRVQVDTARDNYRALKKLLAQGKVELFDRNHVFSVQGTLTETNKVPPILSGQLYSDNSESKVRIGMIDTAISKTHPSLVSASIRHKSFVEDGFEEAQAHGTAIASLIVGQGTVRGLLPKAQLYAASAFYSRAGHSQGATSLSLLQSVNWLLEQDVTVINMSLAGPPNRLLQQAIEKASQQGVVIVAAVGNAGPAASPMYPAAWDKVIAVTAVDEQKQIYRWAVQGEHVDFSARGVAVNVARNPDMETLESGTSLAAPVLACIIASELQAAHTSNENKQDRITRVLNQLALQSQDLGKQGKDRIFGYGYLTVN